MSNGIRQGSTLNPYVDQLNLLLGSAGKGFHIAARSINKFIFMPITCH